LLKAFFFSIKLHALRLTAAPHFGLPLGASQNLVITAKVYLIHIITEQQASLKTVEVNSYSSEKIKYLGQLSLKQLLY
jgi:hypothetical protein